MQRIFLFAVGLFLILLGLSGMARAQPTIKDTALMAARVAINETAFRVQCVPWENRANCVNDLGAIIQRTRHMAERHGRSLYDELRWHSPRATGFCRETPGTSHRRCRNWRPQGNTRFTPFLRVDLGEPEGWARHVALPWAARRASWARTFRDALRLVRESWEPCDQPPVAWAGTTDTVPAWLVQTHCGTTRNRFCVRREGYRPNRTAVPANLARGD